MSLRNPLFPDQQVRGVLFDLDGTLYRQGPLRFLMAMEVATLPLHGLGLARRRWKALAAFRQAQEHLRWQRPVAPVAIAQLQSAATQARLSIDDVQATVDEWMHRRPLKYLRYLRATGLVTLMDVIERAGVPMGVLSDYPARSKLEALGLAARFSLVLSADDPEVGAFKPHPRGFLLASGTWGVHPSEVLVVGDRVDVDAAGASAAGMPCVIIGRGRGTGQYLKVPTFSRLSSVLVNSH